MSASPSQAEVRSSSTYDYTQVEAKWQAVWEEKKLFRAVRREGKDKKYVLDMFPYPSGSGLHVGHPEGYTASDIMARYWRMRDYDVLHPMGWDSFGLPAEQHAINTGTHPAVTTGENIANFKKQLKSLGFSYDWDREIATTDTDYVRWTQWIFLQLFNRGLARQEEALVNWCPALGTVLANEEVIDGLSERGSHPVVRLPLRQWILRITEYADKLEAGLAGLRWPEGTISAQTSWIGRSVGAKIEFPVAESDSSIEVFTTRPDTVMGVTYVVVAPEHPLLPSLTSADNEEAVQKYQEEVQRKSDLERTDTGTDAGKTGVFTGSYATHPLTQEKVPIWVADYVLGGYGTGAVMAVPAHDTRDFAFAEKFDLPVKVVVEGDDASGSEGAMTSEGVAVNSEPIIPTGTESKLAKDIVVRALEDKECGGQQVNYKLRDWVFSRQRYWGEPIPIYFPVECGADVDPRRSEEYTIRFDEPIAVDEADLPLTLPDMDNFEPGDDPQGCLARAVDWRFFQKDGKWYARETNTMPQWAGSCWYYWRFCDPRNPEAACSAQADEDWMPVDLYVGGQEHAVLHLLYARFWHKVMYDLGYTKHPEPFNALIHQGMILGADGEKMSKSRGNVVNPDDIVRDYGADALRLYEMFMGPLEATKPWQTEQLAGVVRFQNRVYNLVKRVAEGEEGPDPKAATRIQHKTIKKVTEDVEVLGLNTAISAMMVLVNELYNNPNREAVEALILLLSPFAPHLSEECWQLLGKEESLALHPWPEYDEELCKDDVIKMGVQVNGKVRGEIELAPDASEEEAMALAKAQSKIEAQLDGKEVKKVIYKAGKILNIVAK
uniref:leucine--tRNA ligase n=1 Tax=Pinguiococcus pyrenoidosus TaxID=172671 RepID=A0A7R9YFC1_9STRA